MSSRTRRRPSRVLDTSGVRSPGQLELDRSVLVPVPRHHPSLRPRDCLTPLSPIRTTFIPDTTPGTPHSPPTSDVLSPGPVPQAFAFLLANAQPVVPSQSPRTTSGPAKLFANCPFLRGLHSPVSIPALGSETFQHFGCLWSQYLQHREGLGRWI